MRYIQLHTPWRVSRDLHVAAMKSCQPEIVIGSREEYLFINGALGGEVGELQNEVKKVARDGMTPKRLKKIAGEVGDVYAYLLHLCDIFGLDIVDCFKTKTEEVLNDKSREWVGNLFDTVAEQPQLYSAEIVEVDNGEGR